MYLAVDNRPTPRLSRAAAIQRAASPLLRALFRMHSFRMHSCRRCQPFPGLECRGLFLQPHLQ